MNTFESTTYTVQKMLSLFGSSTPRQTVISAEATGAIPKADRTATGSVKRRQWGAQEISKLGARFGFMKKPQKPIVATVFTTKGGVLKTTLALNLARMAALHDIRTCVIGLDLQCDITSALGFDVDVSDNEDIQTAILRQNHVRGLADVLHSGVPIEKVVLGSDLPTLFVIPETPELAMAEQDISREMRREYWLKENVTDRLKHDFDLIVLDCSPNWNFLVTNALVACDVLICPLECKINNFRNFSVFRSFTESMQKALKLNFEKIFIPTRLSSTRKLSTSIRAWYMANVAGCTNSVIRESIQGEEALAAKLSIPEYVPKSIIADEMRELLQEIWSKVLAIPAVENAASPDSPFHCLEDANGAIS